MNNLSDRRVLIRVDGSHAIGLGHIYRMKPLATALQSANSRLAFLTMADEVANGLLTTTGLPCYVFRPEAYQAVLQEAIATHQPELVIQDVLETSPEEMEALRHLSPAKIINFDDTGAGLSLADIVINGMVFHRGRYRAGDCRAQLFAGAQYMVLQPEINEYARLDKKIPAQAESILLAFGGSDTHFITGRALQAINNINAPLQVTVNLGPGARLTPCLRQTMKESPHQVELRRAAPNLLKAFYQADLVVCAGGNMLYELAALGVPSVSIAAEPHEVDNINYWSGTGTTVSLGWEKELNQAQVSEAVGALVHNRERRAEMSAIGKQTVDGQGLTRVLKIIEGILR